MSFQEKSLVMYYGSARVRIMNLRWWIVREAVYLWRVRGGDGSAACASAAHIYSSHVKRPREIIRNVPTWPVHYAAVQSGPLAFTSASLHTSFLQARITKHRNKTSHGAGVWTLQQIFAGISAHGSTAMALTRILSHSTPTKRPRFFLYLKF